jgi:hypothetical protein
MQCSVFLHETVAEDVLWSDWFCVESLCIWDLFSVPVMSARAVTRLGGMPTLRNGPTTSVGMMLMKSTPFSLAYSMAAFSARDLDTKYICGSDSFHQTKTYNYRTCYSSHFHKQLCKQAEASPILSS